MRGELIKIWFFCREGERAYVPGAQAEVPGALQSDGLPEVAHVTVVRGKYLRQPGRESRSVKCFPFAVLRVVRRGSPGEGGRVSGFEGPSVEPVRAPRPAREHAALQHGHLLPATARRGRPPRRAPPRAVPHSAARPAVSSRSRKG